MKFRNVLLVLVTTSLTFCLSSCYKWAARAHKELPEQTALDKTYSYQGKVIIVGAGASGLAAAKVLEQNNIDYLLLEATDRYGGRLKKDTTLADFPIDIGAEWIHSNPRVLNIIKGKTGDQIDEDFVPYKLESAAIWNGKKLKPVSGAIRNFLYNFMPESKFKSSTWYDFVNENIAKDVTHNIVYNSAVKSIDYLSEKVVVKTSNGKTYEADKVLVTVSIGVLKSNDINFIPELSPDKKKAIQSITFEPGFKAALKFSEKFYPDAINCKVKNGEKVFYDIAFKKNAKTNILGFLCKGDETEKYYSLKSEQEIINQLLKELDDMYDGKASQTYMNEYLLENWGQYQFTQGTWTQAFQEKKSTLKVLNQPLDNKIYFAGEINDTYKQMGVPGAILSGYYAADKLLTDE
jgi:monoamine oxidase